MLCFKLRYVVMEISLVSTTTVLVQSGNILAFFFVRNIFHRFINQYDRQSQQCTE